MTAAGEYQPHVMGNIQSRKCGSYMYIMNAFLSGDLSVMVFTVVHPSSGWNATTQLSFDEHASSTAVSYHPQHL